MPAQPRFGARRLIGDNAEREGGAPVASHFLSFPEMPFQRVIVLHEVINGTVIRQRRFVSDGNQLEYAAEISGECSV